jgi:hypothetical protein
LGAVGTFVIGGIVGVARLIACYASRKNQIPYGAFLLSGTLAAVLIHGP